MAKQLLVMRHAKSSWADPGQTDYQRPLNERGCRDAPRMAAWIGRQGCIPDLIASSSAVRARQTAELFVAHCPTPNPIRLVMVDKFYHASAEIYLEYLACLADLPDPEPTTVMVVGHNPGLEALVQGISGSHEHFPTAAIAKFRVEVSSWGEIDQKDCQLESLWRPKEVLT
jgi:phosphohistidine phosphatase